jgi:hypothetical protein
MAKATPPARKWTIVPLQKAKEDAKGFLNDVQYLHVVQLVKRLVDFGDTEELADLRIEKIRGDVWELKDKGGVLGKINVRIFFAPVAKRKEIVVLGAFKKEAEGQTPAHVIIKMEARLGDYLEGEQT